MACGLEKLGLFDQNWLERNLSALLLKTLTVGTTIPVDRGCSRYEIRRFDEPFSHWSVVLFVKCRIACLRVTLRELENVLDLF